MKISPLLLMAALCGLVVPAHAAPAETPAGRVAYAPVALQTTDINALLIADVEMDGKSGRFLIDSGASSAMVVNQAFADSLGKTGTAGADIHGIAGNSASKRAMFTGIRVGKTIRMDDQQLNIIMINQSKEMTLGGQLFALDGLVGSKFLKSARLVVDFPNGRLLAPVGNAPNSAFAMSRKQAGDLVLRLTEGKASYPFITVRLKDKDFVFLIDTGASVNSIEPRIVSELGLKTEPSTVGVTGGGGTKKNLDRVVLDKPALSGCVISNLECFVMPGIAGIAAPEGTRFAGIIGTPFLKGYGACLDFDAYALILPTARKNPPPAP